jgi:deazaflavin-dependent oxidoreductase (nitroreductase family)
MSRRGVWTTNHLANPLLRPLLRSALGRRIGRHLALLRVHGRRTGRVYELPVQYARDDGHVWIVPGSPDDKVWWHNLRGDGGDVQVRLAGREHQGHAVALEGSASPVEVARGLAAYLRAFPRAWRALGLPSAPASGVEDLSKVSGGIVMVRVDLTK